MRKRQLCPEAPVPSEHSSQFRAAGGSAPTPSANLLSAHTSGYASGVCRFCSCSTFTFPFPTWPDLGVRERVGGTQRTTGDPVKRASLPKGRLHPQQPPTGGRADGDSQAWAGWGEPGHSPGPCRCPGPGLRGQTGNEQQPLRWLPQGTQASHSQHRGVVIPPSHRLRGSGSTPGVLLGPLPPCHSPEPLPSSLLSLLCLPLLPSACLTPALHRPSSPQEAASP